MLTQVLNQTETQSEATLIKPCSLRENIYSSKVPLSESVQISANQRIVNLERPAYVYSEYNRSYLASQINLFIENENLGDYLIEPSLECILWISTLFMQSATGEHDKNTIFLENGALGFRQLEHYISITSRPNTVCLVFNIAYARVFQSLCQHYAPEFLEEYALSPVIAKSSGDLVRNIDIYSTRREQNHIFLTLVSQNIDGNIQTTPIDPYHTSPGFRLEDINDLDFYATRSSDILLEGSVITRGNVLENIKKINLGLNSSELPISGKIGLAIQSTWQVFIIDKLLQDKKEDIQSKEFSYFNEQKSQKEVEKLNWDLELGYTELQELEALREIAETNILVTLDTFLQQWDGIEPVSLEFVAELIDNVWLHNIEIAPDYFYKIADLLSAHSLLPHEETYEYRAIVRKHGYFDVPKFPVFTEVKDGNPNEGKFDIYALGLNVKAEYFLWLARQGITEWIHKLPDTSKIDNKYYAAFLDKLVEGMRAQDYGKTPELNTLLKLIY